MSIPRPEDVPGYSKNCRDMTRFEEAARALRVSPFYHGPDCVPGNSGSRSGPRQHAVQRLLSGARVRKVQSGQGVSRESGRERHHEHEHREHASAAAAPPRRTRPACLRRRGQHICLLLLPCPPVGGSSRPYEDRSASSSGRSPRLPTVQGHPGVDAPKRHVSIDRWARRC